MEQAQDYLFFIVKQQEFAIPLANIKKVLQVVEMRHVPQMPPFLHGMINFFGHILPIINMHYLFAFGVKAIDLSDQLIILQTNQLKLGLLVDRVLEVRRIDDDAIKAAVPMMYASRYVQGVIKGEDGMVIINDVDAFLDEKQLTEVMEILSVSLEEDKR